MNNTFLLLGGNLDSPQKNIEIATQFISEQIGAIKLKSSIFKSKPWGFEADSDFLNQVLEVETILSPLELLQNTQNIEKQIGRSKKTKQGKYQSRPIDIDILFYNEAIIETPHLIVPHPQLHFRNFTLVPLQEISPNFIHPKLKKSITWLLTHSRDQSKIIKISV